MPLSIRVTDLPALLVNQGDFVILQHADNGRLELQHRAPDLQLVVTPILATPRDPERPELAYSLSRPEWATVHQQRYRDLAALSLALNAAGLTPIATDSPVQLNPQPPAPPQTTADDYALPDQVLGQLMPRLKQPTRHAGLDTISEASAPGAPGIAQQLARAGDFLILATPANGAFELRHRSRNRQIIRTPIVVQRGTPSDPDWQAFSIHKPDWPTISQRPFSSLQQLAHALGQVLSMTQVAHSIPMTLLAAHQTDRTPASLLEQAGRAALADWQQQFSQQAQAFFAEFARQPAVRPSLPLLPANATPSDYLNAMLDTSHGVILGEANYSYASRRFLLEHLPVLQAKGVDSLFLDQLLFDVHQDWLDNFFADGQFQSELLNHLNQVDAAVGLSAGPNRDRFGLPALLSAARAHGIKPLALDGAGRAALAQHAEALQVQLPGFDPFFWKTQAANYLAQQRINTHQHQQVGSKWVALMANQRLLHTEQQIGIAALTRAIGIRVPDDHASAYSQLYLDPGAIAAHPYSLPASVESNQIHVRQIAHFTFHWGFADFLLSHQPARSQFELNLRLPESGNFLLRANPARGQLEILARRRQHAGFATYQVNYTKPHYYFTDPSGAIRSIKKHAKHYLTEAFANLDDLCQALAEHSHLQFIPEQAPEALAQQRSLLETRFAAQRDIWLTRLTILASEDQRRAFKAGREHYQQELAHCQLKTPGDLATLQQLFTQPDLFDRIAPLPQTTAGAVLRAIHELQRQRFLAQSQEWTSMMTRLGGSRVTPISHNLYLAEAQRSRGVCSALAAQLAAAWLLDHSPDAARTGHLERYVARLNRASADSRDAAAKVFGLGLLAWSNNDASAKFTPQAAFETLDPIEILAFLTTAPHTSAYELSFGLHALSIGVEVEPAGERGYYLADPNFGYSEYVSQSACLQGLQRQHQLLRLLPGVDADTRFALRQYRSDLAEQALFPDQLGAIKNPRAMQLADLCGDEELSRVFNANQPLEHDRWFNKLQKYLTLAEYRALLQVQGPEDGMLFGDMLSALLTPYVAERDTLGIPFLSMDGKLDRLQAKLTRARLLRLVLGDHEARLRFRLQTGEHYDLRLDLSRSPDDMALLQRYQRFMQRLLQQQHETGRWNTLRQKLQRGWHQPAVNIDALYLAAALPEESVSAARLMALLKQPTPTPPPRRA